MATLAYCPPMVESANQTNNPMLASLARPFPNSVVQKALVGLLLVLALVVAVATPFTSEDDLSRGGGVGAIAIISFVVFFQSDSNREDRSQGLRRAIAGSTLITFLVVFCLVIFSPAVQEAAGGTEVAQSFISDFRWVVISVVGFYFSSDVVITYLDSRFGDDKPNDGS